jgi:hypothetical protein
MEIDVLIFSIPIALSGLVFIFCGFIPSVSNNGWLLVLRIFIFLATMIVCFFVCNTVINKIISSSSLAEQAITDVIKQERERNETQQTLRELKDEYKKRDDLTYVDISKDD